MLERMSKRMTAACLKVAPAAAVALSAGLAASADDNVAMLQWFETRWRTIEFRMPDFFMSGYDSTWLPPPWKAADPTSAGFDCFDRFDLGSPTAPTAYGTQADMQAMIAEFHAAGALVYTDLVMNHNSGRNGSQQFRAEGAYPQFFLPQNSTAWGDFNNGQTQSMDPGGANYNLFDGDLVGLIDINQASNNVFIRQPIDSVNPQNLPPGTIRNRPNAANRQYYPDLQATSGVLTFRNPLGVNPAQDITIHPIDPSDALQSDPTQMKGDPVTENATALLLRSTQWMMDVIDVDGFRLDAAKHIPVWFWNQYWDNIVFNRWQTQAGTRRIPFSFGEIVESNSFTLGYTRKDGFANRDALDLNGAGALRNVLFSRGLGSWGNVFPAHLDTADDGFQNGSRGVNHVFSHDNGSNGNGGAAPGFPGPDNWGMPQHAYLLFRPGATIVYHNSRQFIDIYQFRGFWPREGNPTALGANGSTINTDLTRLINVANGYARGEYNPLNSTDPQNQSDADVLVFERRRNQGGGNFSANVLVGVNDSYSPGIQLRNVQTSFPPGTRLRELTGNSEDPVVDPTNQIPQTLVVDGNRRVLLPMPNNTNSNNVQHHKGYVIYGPATPSGVLEVSPIASTLPADPASVKSFQRRLTPIDVVTGNTFTLRLRTTKTDPLDPSWDDNAMFKFAGTWRDLNGNGSVDFPESDAFIPGFENFLTFKQTLFANPGLTEGRYEQTISTSLLPEGYNYIRCVAFRQRPGGTDPLYTEFRKVIYVDRLPPSVTLLNAGVPINQPINTFRVVANDRTTTRVHVHVNLPLSTDPVAASTPGSASQCTQFDRREFRRTVSGLQTGLNRVTVVAFEATGSSSVQDFSVSVTVGSGDINRDGVVDLNDLYAGYSSLGAGYDAAADLNADSLFNVQDLRILENSLRPTELQRMAVPPR
jgi:alpha-amylase